MHVLLLAFLACVPASGVQDGCVTTGVQEFAGRKVFLDGLNTDGRYYCGAGITAYPNQSVIITGDRNDLGPSVIIGNETKRDAGFALEVRRGPDSVDKLLVVDTATGNTVTTCNYDQNTRNCSFVDGSGISGHVSLTASPGYYPLIAEKLSMNHTNINSDGGCEGEVGALHEEDGRCYLSFAAHHGGLTVASWEPRPFGGGMFEISNHTSNDVGDSKFYIDVFGGYTQPHHMSRGQFPACPGTDVVTQPQLQYYHYGSEVGAHQYAWDEQCDYICKPWGWVRQKDADCE